MVAEWRNLTGDGCLLVIRMPSGITDRLAGIAQRNKRRLILYVTQQRILAKRRTRKSASTASAEDIFHITMVLSVVL